MKVTRIHTGLDPSIIMVTVNFTVDDQAASIEVKLDSHDRLLSEIKSEALKKAQELLTKALGDAKP